MAGILSVFNKIGKERVVKEPLAENPCIDCDICLEVCEVGIWPSFLMSYAKEGKYEECQNHGIDLCNDCGECSHQCPVNIPLYKYLRTAKILSAYRGNKSGLIPVLLEFQSNYGYLPKDSIAHIAAFLNIPIGHIYSVATFYPGLRLSPPGKRRVCICRGTACHISGAPRILSETEEILGIKEGETSADGEYTLNTVACVGCCALAPVVTVNNETYGKMNSEKIKKLFPAADSEKAGASKTASPDAGHV